MRKVIIVANWKCNPSSLNEAKKLFLSVKKKVKYFKNVEIVIAPPFIYLLPLKMLIKNNRIILAAQNLFFQDGPFTGEISPKMLKNGGIKYVIVGHSERRKMGETDKIINYKVRAALKNKLIPILCVGEKKGDDVKKVIEKQLQQGLKGIKSADIARVFIAYEPVWAIGSGKSCGFNEALTITILIRNYFQKRLGKRTASQMKILYGGSVNSSNAKGFIQEAGMNGLLIGGASLYADEFLKILHQVDTIM